ncbi:small lysine-rich protein 1 [Peromyscus leucopus]|uniref:small lysine-rich protein 1 n=1 Tax=Peromyscus leucopus TaxID=10041 RepID=UPI0010A13A48|nr:small lysine-rich protein 1 [Peromyscus leucopus]
MSGWAAYVSKTQEVCKVFSKYRAAQPLESGEPGLDQRPSGWQLAEPAQLPQKHLCPRTQRGHPTEATAGAGGNAQSGKGKKGKPRAKTGGKKQKLKRPEPDILSPAAMLNLYYIAHNVADCLYLRGYPWPGAPKGKRGKSKI